jgi:hypothetical protein
MKIFISYRRKDSAREVGRIRDRLMLEFGEKSVFRDLVDIEPGRDFRSVLEEETNTCNVMLVVIGPLWAGITDDQGTKRLFAPEDFTRKEVEKGLNRLPTGKILIVPVLVLNAQMPSSAELPESLCMLTYQNAISVHDDPYFEYDMGRLIDSIFGSEVYAKLDIPKEPFEPQTVYVPEGSFLMGSRPGKEIPEYETPEHEVNLPAYRLGIHPVTNVQYEAFILETQRPVIPVTGWDGRRVPTGLEDHPVTGLSWYDALAYCQWLSEKVGRKYSLPNEAQWEKACRESHDLSEPMGRILEWTCSLWGEKRNMPDAMYSYPWKNDGRNDLKIDRPLRRVIRGYVDLDETGLRRFSARYGRTPDDHGSGILRHGFRVVLPI